MDASLINFIFILFFRSNKENSTPPVIRLVCSWWTDPMLWCVRPWLSMCLWCWWFSPISESMSPLWDTLGELARCTGPAQPLLRLTQTTINMDPVALRMKPRRPRRWLSSWAASVCAGLPSSSPTWWIPSSITACPGRCGPHGSGWVTSTQAWIRSCMLFWTELFGEPSLWSCAVEMSIIPLRGALVRADGTQSLSTEHPFLSGTVSPSWTHWAFRNEFWDKINERKP